MQQIHQQMQQQPQQSVGGLYVPPGYVYQTSEGRVGNRRVTVSASAYPGHFAPQPGAPIPSASTSFVPPHSRSTASAPPSTSAYQVYPSLTPASRTVPAAGNTNAPKKSQQSTTTPQYYYDPRTNTATNNAPVMTQVSSTNPVTIPQTATTAPVPRTSTTKKSSSTTRRQAPAPPSTPNRKSSRTPLSSQPVPQEQVPPPVTPVVRTGGGGGTTAPSSSKRVSTSTTRRISAAPAPATTSSAPSSTTQPYNSSRGKVVDAFNRYSAFWKGSYSPRTLTFSSVPWPVVDAPKHPTSLNVNAVRSFLLSPHHSQGVPARERVEHAQSIWEPKSFMATLGHKMREEEEKEKIERTLLFLQGTLRILYNEVVAAESLDDG
ncbi:hypothetical protein FRB90_002318, partial [Tulasnella sp. 427]